jgi:hypothetical protein
MSNNMKMSSYYDHKGMNDFPKTDYKDCVLVLQIENASVWNGPDEVRFKVNSGEEIDGILKTMKKNKARVLTIRVEFPLKKLD